MEMDSEDIFAEMQTSDYSVTGENDVNVDYEHRNIEHENGVESFSSLFADVKPDDDLFKKDPSIWKSEDLVGKVFKTVGAAEQFYRLYSKLIGFGFRRDNQERDKEKNIIVMRRWVCSREGTRSNKNIDRPDRKREPRIVTRCNCKASFIVRYKEKEGYYRISTFKPEHNHEVANPKQVHFFRCNRQITTGQAMEIRTMKDAGIKTCQIMDFMVTALGGFSNVGFTSKDLYNFISTDQERTRRMNTDAEATIAYFNALAENNPGLYMIYSVDADSRLSRLFWADSRSKQDYSNFGDVLVIDSTYKTNAFKMPLVEFVGINNHQCTVIFGCALLCDESVDAYVWCFRYFLDAMGGKIPISVISDGDRAIASALGTVMPQVRHRLCSWHLMRNARGMSHDSDFLSDFRRCMLNHQTIDSFEETWQAFRRKYGHVNSVWMDELYERKHKWAEAFFRGVFFGGMTTNQRCESTNAYMNRFLNCDLSLYTFVKQYYRAMFRLRENVLRLDFTNAQGETLLQTHLKSIEGSASSFYSRSAFLKVRDEINKEAGYTPVQLKNEAGGRILVLKKFGNRDGKETTVTVDGDKTLSCTCGRFESVGLPCRHMFCAMKALNIEKIPAQMLKNRWAKTDTVGTSGVPKETTIKNPGNPNEQRYGSLLAKAHQLCNIAAKTDNAYIQVMSVFESTISLLPHGLKQDNNMDAPDGKRSEGGGLNANIIRDPEIVRTKGCSQSEGKGGKAKKRKCGYCKEAGHYKSNCPKIGLDEKNKGIETTRTQEYEGSNS